jgi:hypothetical protein
MQATFKGKDYKQRDFMTCAEFLSHLNEHVATYKLHNKPITIKIGSCGEFALLRDSLNMSETVADDRLTIELELP